MKSHRSYSDHEIASYVLGLDMPDHAGGIQTRLAHDDAAAAQALKWEAYFLGIVDALPPAPPPAELLAQIQATLGMENLSIMGESREPRPHQPPSPEAAPTGAAAVVRHPGKRLSTRRLLLAVGTCAVVVAVVVLVWASLKPPPTGTIVQQPLQLAPK